MSAFGIRAFDDQGRDTVHMVSNFVQPILTITGSGSKTYEMPPGSKLYAFPTTGIWGAFNMTVSGNTVTWSAIQSPLKVMIVFSLGAI